MPPFDVANICRSFQWYLSSSVSSLSGRSCGPNVRCSCGVHPPTRLPTHLPACLQGERAGDFIRFLTFRLDFNEYHSKSGAAASAKQQQQQQQQQRQQAPRTDPSGGGPRPPGASTSRSAPGSTQGGVGVRGSGGVMDGRAGGLQPAHPSQSQPESSLSQQQQQQQQTALAGSRRQLLAQQMQQSQSSAAEQQLQPRSTSASRSGSLIRSAETVAGSASALTSQNPSSGLTATSTVAEMRAQRGIEPRDTGNRATNSGISSGSGRMATSAEIGAPSAGRIAASSRGETAADNPRHIFDGKSASGSIR